MTQVLSTAAFRKPKPVALPEGFLTVAYALGLPIPVGPPTHYRIRRYRPNPHVEVRFPGGLTINVTLCQGVILKDFAEARRWIAAWSERHGFKMEETTRRLHEIRPQDPRGG